MASWFAEGIVRSADRICPPLIDIEQACMTGLAEHEQRHLVELLTTVQQTIAARRTAT